MPLRILLDTDLGSDVDDELALALLWGSPEVDLVGVSTTYGDVALRAAIVRRMAELTGRRVAVERGAGQPLSGKPVWWAGIEGEAYGALVPARVQEDGGPPPGVGLLVDRAPGAELLAIGPLTSVAVALERGLEGLAGITIMGGDFADPSAAEHNLASDVDAAQRVLGSGLPITVVGVDVTRRVRFADQEIRRFEATGGLGRIVAAEMRAWMARWDEDFEVPHDPLTALALLQPELFTWTDPLAVQVADDGSVRTAGPGTVRIATGVDMDAARVSMADRIVQGLRASAAG